MSICKWCNEQITDKNRTKFCSDNHQKKFHSKLSNKKKTLENKATIKKAKSLIKKQLVLDCKYDKEKLVSLIDLGYRPQKRISISSSLGAMDIHLPKVNHKKQRFDSEGIWNYQVIAININILENVIKIYHKKYADTASVVFKNARERWLKIRTDIINYLKENQMKEEMIKKFDFLKFVCVKIGNDLYCVVDEDDFGDNTFKCVNKKTEEFIFNYKDVVEIIDQ